MYLEKAEVSPDGGAGVECECGAVEAVVEVSGDRHHHRPLAAVQVLCSHVMVISVVVTSLSL